MRKLACFWGILGLLFLAGCGSGSRRTGAPVTVQINPTMVALGVQETQTFLTQVSNTTNKTVSFTVQEGAAGGTITPAGVYTAPNTPGTYHVIATSQADPALSA